jgi:hypothetical protein
MIKNKGGKMKKILIGFALVSLLFCFTTIPASAASTGKCVEMYWDWSGTGNFDGPCYVLIDNNGTFFDSCGSQPGKWYENKGARFYIYDEAPNSIASGKKYSGFLNHPDISSVGVIPGLWYMKGTKKTNCDFATTVSSQTLQRGLSANSPE